MAKMGLIVIVLFSYFLQINTASNCGRPMVDGPSPQGTAGARIVGGRIARPGAHPWIVSLQKRDKHFCAGSLISVGNMPYTDIVLTAGHCFAVPDGGVIPLSTQFYNVTAVAGVSDITNTTAGGLGQQKVQVMEVYVHEHYVYNDETVENDICILKLASPIYFDDYVQPICLPSPGLWIKVKTMLTVAGWGFLSETSYAYSNILMQVDVPVISHRQCSEYLKYYEITIKENTTICAGYTYGGMDACQGDSGGPVILKRNDGAYYQIGIVSFGIGCANENTPGVYTRVSHYVHWINWKIATHSSLSGKENIAKIIRNYKGPF